MKRKGLTKEDILREGTPANRPEHHQQILLTNRTNRQWFILTEREKKDIDKERNKEN